MDDIPSDVEEDEDDPSDEEDTMHVDRKKKSSSSVRSSANSSFVLGRASSHASYRSMSEHDPSHVDKSDTMQIFVSEEMLLEADRQLKHLSHSTLAVRGILSFFLTFCLLSDLVYVPLSRGSEMDSNTFFFSI